jgi:hypothetical protein
LPLWQIEKRRDIPDLLPGTAASFMPVERFLFAGSTRRFDGHI